MVDVFKVFFPLSFDFPDTYTFVYFSVLFLFKIFIMNQKCFRFFHSILNWIRLKRKNVSWTQSTLQKRKQPVNLHTTRTIQRRNGIIFARKCRNVTVQFWADGTRIKHICDFWKRFIRPSNWIFVVVFMRTIELQVILMFDKMLRANCIGSSLTFRVNGAWIVVFH